jgi:SAM-dependent methyltransferase
MFTTFDFGYPWWLTDGPAVPLGLALLVGALAVWRGWRRLALVAGVVGVWAAGALIVGHAVLGLNRPMTLPAEFLATGAGRVLDVGAGSGRAALGVLLARPQTTVTALDIYSGYWGIEENTPERFMANAQAAGVAQRADVVTADMREMPFPDGTFDAVISSYAIDHLRRDGRARAVAEVARVLKPRGELLLAVVRVDWRTWFVSPILAHHPSQEPGPWRALLDANGFDIEREGTEFLTLYFVARKRI